jgi:hypothetical protein
VNSNFIFAVTSWACQTPREFSSWFTPDLQHLYADSVDLISW